MKKLLELVISVFALVGFAGAVALVVADANQPGICPVALGVPACYFAVLFFLMIAIGHFPVFDNARIRAIVFFTGSGVGTLVAAYASFFQPGGASQCPEFGALPLCYAALVLYAGSGILKLISQRLD